MEAFSSSWPASRTGTSGDSNDLDFRNLDLGTGVTCGAGCLARLPELLRQVGAPGNPVLLVSDPGIVAAGLTDRSERVLSEAGLKVELFSDLGSDPKAAEIDAAAKAAARSGGPVIGLGGGSALDVAKLAAAIAGSGASASEFALGAGELPARSLPLVAVPTTAGTGAEVTGTVVFSDSAGAKLWCYGDGLRPDLVLLDPELTLGLPRPLTAATGADVLVHAIEAATNRRAGAESRRWAIPAIGLASRYLPLAVAEGDDVIARGALLVAACLAGRAIDVAGTGAAHAFGHALGGLGGVHHGRAVAVSLAALLAGNAEAAPQAHAEVARALGLEGDDGQVAGGLAARFSALLDRIGLQRCLADHGLGPDHAKQLAAVVAEPANRPMLEANCRHYTEEELLAIARAILSE